MMSINKVCESINQGLATAHLKGSRVHPLVEFSYHKTDSFRSLGIVFL